MQRNITFVTGNAGKMQVVSGILQKFGIEVVQQPMETPEIQSLSVEDVACYSAAYAAKELGRPIIKTDVGYYFNAFNGFPGPFIKYINKTLTPSDLLNLFREKQDRGVVIKECVAYAAPGLKPIAFVSSINARIAEKPAGTGSTIDQLMILEGFTVTKGAADPAAVAKFWDTKLHHFYELGEYLKGI